MEKVIVISAHPDDEALGCGGTLLKHAHKGDELYWLIVTNISTSKGFTEERVASRQQEIKDVAKQLGIKKTYKLDYNTMHLSDESLITMIPKISEIFNDVQPNTVYSLNRSDAHSDHRIVYKAISACTKSFRYPFIRKVLMYECISETEFSSALAENAFVPNYFVDITPFINKKIEIMKIYESEIDDHPFPRSEKNILALATFRGAMANVAYAEAFQLLKFIDK